MSMTQSRMKELELEEADRKFASKSFGYFLYLPSLVPLATSFLLMGIGLSGPTTNSFLVMASLLGLISGFFEIFRRKILRQDEAIKQLQEQLREVNTPSD